MFNSGHLKLHEFRNTVLYLEHIFRRGLIIQQIIWSLAAAWYPAEVCDSAGPFLFSSFLLKCLIIQW